MNDLLRLLPPIRRARGNRLYTADGKRFLDLWLDDGRGILGDRDRYARTFAANAADKGLTRPYPGLYDARFAKAVQDAWPGFGAPRLFSSEERALAAAARILDEQPEPVDPATGAATGGAAFMLARPFADLPAACVLAMPRLPCPRPFSPWCLMARAGTSAAAALAAEEGDLVPAQALSAAARGLASLASAIREGYGESHWAKADRRLGAWFERRGPYLFAKCPPADYEAFFRAALAGGALLSPRTDAPSVVPPDFDDGELAKLARALGRLTGT